MDIKPDLIKKEPEFVDFTETIVSIKSESEYDVSMNDIKTEQYMDIEKQINKTSGTSIKQELDDDMWTIGVMKEEVPEVKEEPSLNDDVVEKLPEIKTEEVMLKNESEDGDSETEAYWKNHMIDHTIKHQNRKLRNRILAKDNSSSKRYSCDYCNYEAFTGKNLKYHMRVMCELDKTYRCDVCDYKAQFKGLLNNHLVNRHGKTLLKKYCCDICTYRCFKKNDLDIHKVVKHDDNFKK